MTNRSMLMALAFLFGCDGSTTSNTTGSGGGEANDPIPTAPTQPSEVGSAYQAIGNSCNDGKITRTLTAVRGLDPDNLWDAPANDRAALVSPKLVKGGWSNLIAVGELTYDGITDNVSSTSAAQAQRCGGARSIFTPQVRDERSHFMNVLLYAAEHPHVDQFPESGNIPDPIDTAVRLRGYIDLSSGLREDTANGVLYRDVKQQVIPISISCEKPLRVSRFAYQVQADAVGEIDLASCSQRGSIFLCLYEAFEHVADNRCTFVATDAQVQAPDGTDLRLSLGGRLETKSGTDPIKYTLTVDRYAFHKAN